MTNQGDIPERLSTFPEYIVLEHYAAPDIMDMMIWRHVNEQRDQVIIRAWRRGVDKTKIAETMGIGRTTVWRVIERYLKANPGCPHKEGEKRGSAE